MTIKVLSTVLYMFVVFYLGYRGWKDTKVATDYMLAGRRMHPFVMAMSYGATFVSTSAIIGFGGVAGMFGFPLMWLTFLNIVVGVWFAMTVLGKRTRRMGLALDCMTFPELLGERYASRFIQGFAGLVIFLFVPIYAAAVLIGISHMIVVALGFDFNTALVGFTLILALYVITGGLKAVMYTDAFQGTIMIVMMVILVVVTYSKLGGVIPAHQSLTAMADLMPEKLRAGGMLGWTQGIRFGTPIWLTVYTTIVYGVGIGVLAQPQLVVRFMTVESDRELNRAVLYGGLFILLLPGVPYVVGALSNAVFLQTFGKISIDMAGGNFDRIIPIYIDQIMPEWFSGLFLMAMFAAAMSTLSSQYHVGGTSLGRDFFHKAARISNGDTFKVTQLGVAVTIFMTLVWAWVLPGGIIARATAFFFGLCAAAFLPAYMLGLYWKGMTRAGAIVSMLGGFAASMFWLLFVHLKESASIGVCEALTGLPSIAAAAAKGSWPWLLQWVDPNVVALPVSFALAVGVSLMTKPLDEAHVARCWSNFR
ncbi:SSS family solute:Na+ symporter [Desulfobaculum xiamenense]|uniref:SSS family solute:Na+ symporter n=1 Tax=Desulfobaculum xiamenense TaxID=995050 RepID=A0A846QTB4_9BACT|nr:sodium:solute symporter family protein [Desulfobaculum xiamenense]NJB68705.1 SSS family solute:Na+ symporter [Desulfobaculum xiamenense]